MAQDPPHAPVPPAPHPPRITEPEAEDLLHGICFKTGPPRLVGAELEWLVWDPANPHVPPSAERLAAAHAAAGALPLRSALTVEPGGQLELSSSPATSPAACVAELDADLTAVRAALAPLGLTLVGRGLDPRPTPRYLRSPRYDAMERYFDRIGSAGHSMMCGSASVQVCVDAGHEADGPLGHRRRWELAHLLGAVLVAAFANSPGAPSGPYAGWRSARQGLWADLDPARSLAPDPAEDPRRAWPRSVLDTHVMCVRRDETGSGAGADGAGADGAGAWEVPEKLSFRDWLRGGDAGRPARREDLDYHLTTLFPPVRPRGGHLELRMIDAQPGADGWMVPILVVHALFDDPEAGETAWRVVRGLAERSGPEPAPRNELWRAAARLGPADPELRSAARACFRAAEEALPRLGVPEPLRARVAEFTERYVARGRCPADDETDPWRPVGADAREAGQP
ncbi:ergothioneine biosynthesis glutamate--cysteine ligase EgtA [Streptomyces sp. BI20]|uniref:ergothioneine biosynthesis glutamate--cysteine ligase EgtA n=1 Tax=Streptomyces sp. BI20 TaxID=3403460 RepID=UPI003C7167F4